MKDHFAWMRLALEEAEKSVDTADVPVGALVVLDDEVIGRGRNEREALQDPTAHAEISALRSAARTLGRWYLEGAVLYTTVEPCTMCMGAAALARVKTVVFGCKNPKGGASSLCPAVFKGLGMTHVPEVVGGILEKEAAGLVSGFFKSLRLAKQSVD